jgi:hypothetical protein
MFGVGIGHNAKRRIERQLFFQRLAESITLAAQLVILRFQCRQLLQFLVAPWWRHRFRGEAAPRPEAQPLSAWGELEQDLSTDPSGGLWARTAGLAFDYIRRPMILSLAFRLIADDKCIQKIRQFRAERFRVKRI